MQTLLDILVIVSLCALGMSLSNSDMVWFGAADMEEVDGATEGGAIDTTTIITFDDPTAVNSLATTVDYVSTNAGDTTQTVTVTGRTASGSIATEAKILNGTTPVNGAVTFARILKVDMSTTAVGTVNVQRHSDGDLLCHFPVGIKQVRRLFYNVSADTSSGSTRNYYDKAFLKNTNGTFAALSLTFEENSDPSGDVTLAVESSVNGSGTSTNRQTAPSGVTGDGFGSGPTAIPGTDLAPGDAIGLWFNLTLAAGAAAATTTYTPEADFETI